VRSLRHETKGKRAQGTVGRLKLSDTRQDTTQRGAAREIGGIALTMEVMIGSLRSRMFEAMRERGMYSRAVFWAEMVVSVVGVRDWDWDWFWSWDCHEKRCRARDLRDRSNRTPTP
jgi:hypothetical protein